MAEQPDNVGRRITRRRGGTGVSFGRGGLSASTEGTGRLSSEDDTLDDEIQDLNASVAERVGAPRRPVERPAVTETPGYQAPPNPDDPSYTPNARLAQVAARSPEYAIEYRQQLMMRMMMRNLPMDEIASQLGISLRQAQRDRLQIRERMRQLTKELEIEAMIGTSASFYDEIQALSLRIADNNNTPTPMRLAAMRVSLASHNDKQRFFQAAGVFDVLRYRKNQDGSAGSDVQRLMAATEDLLQEVKSSSASSLMEPVSNPLGDFTSADGEIVDL